MGFYSEDIVREIRSRADIVDVISEYISLKKQGENYVGLCPFHTEKTPSFNVNPEKQLFYCFGCGTGGNVFTFLMKRENLNFSEAVRFLADRLQIKLPQGKYDKEITRDFQQRRELLRLNKLAAGFYHNNLLNTREGRRGFEYLIKRGIKADTIERFQLGYALPSWDSLIRYFRSQGIEINVAHRSGLVIPGKDHRSYYDRFRDRIIFPIEDVAKNIIGFGGRVVGAEKPKYLNSPETPVFSKGENLYALSMIKKDPEIDAIVVEGYMDCITLQQNGFTQAVASLGTALTQKQARLLKKYTNGVILAYDADSAGRTATLRGAEILAKEGLNVKILSLPAGKDPDEFIRKEGGDAFREQLSGALDPVSYKLSLEKKRWDIRNPDGKLRFIRRAVQLLAEIESQVEKEIYIQKIAAELNIPVQVLKDEVQKKQFPNNGYKYKNTQIRDNNKEFNKKSPLTGAYKAERMIIKLLMEDENIREKVMGDLEPSMFFNERTCKIAGAFFKMTREGESITTDGIFNLLDQDASSELSSILMANLEIGDDVLVDSLLKTIKENYLKHAIKQVRDQIKKAEAVGKREETIDLLSTYQKLKSQMDELKANLTSEKGGV